MKLKLKRPLVFFDLETTGVDVKKDRIIEIGAIKLNPDGTRVVRTTLVNPERPIPKVVTELTGITDEDVAGAPTFKKIASRLFVFMNGCDVAGFNSNKFDVPFLYNEFARSGINWDHRNFRMIDVGNIYKIKERRTLSAAVKFYLDRDLDDAHSAEADISATVDVLEAQLEMYDDLPTELEELDRFCNYDKKRLDLSGYFVLSDDDPQVILLNFGKHKDKPAKDNLSYLSWMFNSDFPNDTKEICRRILKENGVF